MGKSLGYFKQKKLDTKFVYSMISNLKTKSIFVHTHRKEDRNRIHQYICMCLLIFVNFSLYDSAFSTFSSRPSYCHEAHIALEVTSCTLQGARGPQCKRSCAVCCLCSWENSPDYVANPLILKK